MKHLKGLFDFYINSSIHVAFAVLSLVFVTEKELELSLDFNFNAFIFLGTITGYNFVKYASVAGLHHRNLTKRLKVIQLFSFVCILALAYFAFQFDFEFWLSCAPLALLTALYAVPFLPNKANLRTLPTLKIFIIAVVWAGVTVYLPVVYEASAFTTEFYLMLAQRFMLVLALIIPFERRDLTYDSAALGTLPQVLGIKKTKLFGLSMVLGGVILEVLKTEIVSAYSIIQYCILLITAFAILKSSTKQSSYYASFFVEGIPILWAIFILAF